MKIFKSKSALIAFGLMACTLAGRAAPIDAVTISGNYADSYGPINVGFEFTLSQTTTISALGVWDNLGDGLSASHDVGIWNLTGSLLASTTVAAGTGATLDNGFRFNDISPLTLVAGTYVALATFANSADSWAYDGTINTAAGVTWNSDAWNYQSTLSAPTNFNPQPGYFGANFQIGTADSSVPDGGTTTAMLGFALFGLAALRRKFARA